jgi:hypothetical protein
VARRPAAAEPHRRARAGRHCSAAAGFECVTALDTGCMDGASPDGWSHFVTISSCRPSARCQRAWRAATGRTATGALGARRDPRVGLYGRSPHAKQERARGSGGARLLSSHARRRTCTRPSHMRMRGADRDALIRILFTTYS